jgi:hypothetical protein
VAVLGPVQDTQLLKVEDKEHFAENPPSFEDFQGKNKNCTLLQYFVKQTRSKDYENWQGLFREVV